MDKKLLVQIIESFYLNGLTSQVKFKVKDNQAYIKFSTDNKDCIGEIIAPIQLEDCEIGIYNTGQLLKLLGITTDYIELNLAKQNGHFLRLNISDNQFDLVYNLSDLGLIQDPSVISNLPPHDLEFDINFDFIHKLVKAHNALDKFSAVNLREIVSVSKSAKGKAYIFKDGLMKIQLEEDGIKSEYYIVAFSE